MEVEGRSRGIGNSFEEEKEVLDTLHGIVLFLRVVQPSPTSNPSSFFRNKFENRSDDTSTRCSLFSFFFYIIFIHIDRVSFYIRQNGTESFKESTILISYV